MESLGMAVPSLKTEIRDQRSGVRDQRSEIRKAEIDRQSSWPETRIDGHLDNAGVWPEKTDP
jgi:hypothetical protein